MKYTNLDNPVWNSLNETHNSYAIEFDGVKYYKPQYCHFGGFVTTENRKQSIEKYSDLVEDFYIVGKKPNLSEKIILINKLVCNQMVLNTKIDLEFKDEIIELTTEKHKLDLFNLVNLAFHGFFMSNTADLGKYFGIYKNNELIAVTGERLKMNEFTEISAVVTHPNHIGNGYAKQLITHTANVIMSEGKTPYLHVSETNFKAINLYEKLGFITRIKMNFWHLKANNSQLK